MMALKTGIIILCGFSNASAFLVHQSSIDAVHQASATASRHSGRFSTTIGPLYYKPDPDDDVTMQPTVKQSSRSSTVGPLYYKSSADNDDDSPPQFSFDNTNPNNDASTSSSSSTTTSSPRPPRRSFLHQLDRFLTILQHTSSHLKKHTFLSGNFAPVAEEHVQVPVQVVEGSIPDGLDGAFCRNGPNPVVSQMRKRYHWVSSFMS